MTMVCLGDLPEPLRTALDAAEVPVRQLDLLDDPIDCQLLLVHSADGSLDPDVGPWLDHAARTGTAVAFSVSRVTPAFVEDVFLPHGLALVVRTDPMDASDVAQLTTLARELLAPPRPPAGDDFPIGSVFGRPESVEQYESSRALSLLGPSMSTFMADLSDVTRRLVSHLPPHSIPWDPDDLSETALVEQKGGTYRIRSGAVPNLSDLFTAHDDSAARDLLRNRPAAREGEASGHPPAVLILGESGTGKSLVAATFHKQLRRAVARRDRREDVRVPFVQVNCGGMTSDNFDHILFGAAPGTFTGVSATVGVVARAAYGLIFFDEIGDLTLGAQQRLLTFLDHRQISPTGMAPFPAYVHVVAATNRDLATLVAQGRFRHDLLSRFATHLTIPPMRERDSDEIRRLVDFVASNPAANPGRRVSHISSAAMDKLLAMPLREGNFRELESVVHAGLRAAIRRRSPFLEDTDIDSWEESFVPDELERVVQVDAAFPSAPTDVPVRSLREIYRLGHLLGRPLLRSPDGELVVRDGEVIYRRVEAAGDGRPQPSRAHRP